MNKGQYQLLIGIVLIAIVGVSLAIASYYTILKPTVKTNQTTTTTSTTTNILMTTTSSIKSSTTTSTSTTTTVQPPSKPVQLILEDSYKQNESVEIKVKNNGNKSIYYDASGCGPSSSYEIIFPIAKGKIRVTDPCLPCPTLLKIVEIKPGEIKTIDTWNQNNYYTFYRNGEECKSQLEMAHSGKYIINFTYSTNSNLTNKFSIDKEITICVQEGWSADYGSTCCSGLKWIGGGCAPGTACCGSCGYCTNCGDKLCKSPENKYNCPEDCKRGLVAIFIDEDTCNQLNEEIERYKSDIIDNLGVNVVIHKGSWSSANQVRNIILEHYNNDGFLGSVLIGNIPTAYFDNGVITDWYYEDMSDKFIDSNGDGKFEFNSYNLTDITMREAWSGRIKSPIGGSEGIELLRKYFDRNHAYRTGSLTYDQKLLYFNNIAIDETLLNEDEYTESAKQMSRLLYGNENQMDMIYNKNASIRKAEYLSKITLPYEVVYVNIHGWITSQYLGNNNLISVDDIKNNPPKSLFVILQACYNGKFIDDDYLAGWYLFAGNALAVEASTIMENGTNLGGLKNYGQLKLGISLGELHKNDGSFLIWHLFGDPTLKLRQKTIENMPIISPDVINFDFGDIPINSVKKTMINLTNNGNGKFITDLGIYECSFNNGYCTMCPFYYVNGGRLGNFEIPPLSSKGIEIVFELIGMPRIVNYSTGNYSQKIVLYTNDPETPYLYLNLRGRGV